MHSDHDVFVQGIQQKRKIKFTLRRKINHQNLVRQYVPLYYSKAQVEGHGTETYYVWDLEATNSGRFRALSPSQIVKMELAEEKFNLEEFICFEKTQHNQ